MRCGMGRLVAWLASDAASYATGATWTLININ